MKTVPPTRRGHRLVLAVGVGFNVAVAALGAACSSSTGGGTTSGDGSDGAASGDDGGTDATSGDGAGGDGGTPVPCTQVFCGVSTDDCQCSVSSAHTCDSSEIGRPSGSECSASKVATTSGSAQGACCISSPLVPGDDTQDRCFCKPWRCEAMTGTYSCQCGPLTTIADQNITCTGSICCQDNTSFVCRCSASLSACPNTAHRVSDCSYKQACSTGMGFVEVDSCERPITSP